MTRTFNMADLKNYETAGNRASNFSQDEIARQTRFYEQPKKRTHRNKASWKQHKHYLRYFFYVVLYGMLLILVKYTPMYEKGLSPDNYLSIVVIAFLIFSRFMTFLVLPAILWCWFWNLILNRKEIK